MAIINQVWDGRAFVNTDSDTVDQKNVNDGAATSNTLWTSIKVSNELAKKAEKDHTHSVSQVSGLHAIATTGNYESLTNKPTIPAAYVHPNDANTRHVTDAEKATWNSKANGTHTHNYAEVVHSHQISQITNLQSELDNIRQSASGVGVQYKPSLTERHVIMASELPLGSNFYIGKQYLQYGGRVMLSIEAYSTASHDAAKGRLMAYVYSPVVDYTSRNDSTLSTSGYNYSILYWDSKFPGVTLQLPVQGGEMPATPTGYTTVLNVTPPADAASTWKTYYLDFSVTPGSTIIFVGGSRATRENVYRNLKVCYDFVQPGESIV